MVRDFDTPKKRLIFRKEIMQGKNPTRLFTGDYNKEITIDIESCSEEEKQELWDKGYHYLFES